MLIDYHSNNKEHVQESAILPTEYHYSLWSYTVCICPVHVKNYSCTGRFWIAAGDASESYCQPFSAGEAAAGIGYFSCPVNGHYFARHYGILPFHAGCRAFKPTTALKETHAGPCSAAPD